MTRDLFMISYAALWVLVATLAVAVFALYQHFGQMYIGSPAGRARHGPEEESQLASRTAVALDGSAVAIPPEGTPALLLFTTTTCRLCSELRGSISAVAQRHPEVATVVICGGHRTTVAAWSQQLDAAVTVVIDKRRALAATYRIGLTPFLVAVDATGVVRIKGIAGDEAALEFAAHEVSSAHTTVSTAQHLEVSHG
jgi:thioredoxin-related protein